MPSWPSKTCVQIVVKLLYSKNLLYLSQGMCFTIGVHSLYPFCFAARPGFQRPAGSTSAKSYLEPVPTTEKGLLPAGFIMEDPDSHFVYVCRKMDETTDLIHVPSYPLTADVL